MTERAHEAIIQRVFLVERDSRLREAIESVLQAEGIGVVRCDGVTNLFEAATGAAGEVALLAWTAASGMLGEDQRPRLQALSGLVPLVLMVPSSWRKLVTAEQLGVAGVLAKPFGADALIAALEVAVARRRVATGQEPTLEATS